MRTEHDVWRYRPGLEVSTNLTGFSVEALDGAIGKIDECTTEVTGTYLVVDTGLWIFGRKVMLPGSVIERIDYDSETVYVNRNRGEIRNAPAFDENAYRSDLYRAEVGGYYGGGSASRSPG
jgi:hypothetical protein